LLLLALVVLAAVDIVMSVVVKYITLAVKVAAVAEPQPVTI
jgi:hypothetical protein